VADTDAIREALRDVIDPEIGINVVDLGLVYGVRRDDGGVHVTMTMTTAACPLGESIAADAKAAIRRKVPGVATVDVSFVWEPRWQPSMMSASARARLGWA
jgi:metal-sulfur cluster biosynthetic enzyme